MRVRNILILLVILVVLGGYYYYSNIPLPSPKPEPRPEAWSVSEEEIQHIVIRLPREDKSQAFLKEEDRSWHFDDPQRSAVNKERWGGGIPLLLSGPGAERLISENTTQEELAKFGLTQPRMEITLTLEDRNPLNVTIGDKTPDGKAFYVQDPGSNDVYTVDYSWYEVFERLVKEPPYVPTSAD